MATKFPLIPDSTTGVPRPIAAGDTIDSSVLPASTSGGVPLNTSGSYATWTVPSTDQVYAPHGITNDGEMVVDGELVLG